MAAKNKKKKSLLRRILKWTGITFLLLIILLITLPFIFKDQLIQLVKDEANKNLNAKVDFGEFDLSLLSTFPDFTFDIQNVTVDGVDRFEGVRLAEIKNTGIALDLMSVISGDKIEIKKIMLQEPTFHVIVDKEGFANYDIAKSDSTASADTTVAEEESGEETKYAIGLQKLSIEKANIIYDDQPGAMYADIKNLNFDLSGDFTQNIVDASSKLDIDALTYQMDGISYMRKNKLALDADVAIENFTKYTLKENSLKVNELELGFDGWLELLEESMNMDVTFQSKQTSFKSILSLVPAVFLTDFNNVETRGKLALSGNAKGVFKDENYPEFNLDLSVVDGYFKYPDLPNAVENINIATKISHPQGIDDLTRINVSKFHIDLAKNPVDMTLNLSKPVSDPKIKSDITAKLDLATLKTVIPVNEGEDYQGLVDADLHLAGKLSALEKEQYQDFTAEGTLLLKDIIYKTPDLAYDVNVSAMDMFFTPQHVDLKTLNTQIGSTDLAVNGKIDNILLYVLKDENLQGTFNVSSNKLNADELMAAVPEETTGDIEEAEKPENTASSTESGVIEIPANYDVTLNTDIKEILYDGLTIKNVKGQVTVKDQIANLKNLSLSTLGGNVLVNGSYNTQAINPKVDFNYNIQSVAVEQMVEYISTIETLAPIAKRCKGNISTSLQFSTLLDQEMSPILTSMTGMGDLQSNNLAVAGVKVLEKLADKLKIKEISNQTIKNLNMSFMFEDGKAIVKPFNTQISGMKTEVSGYTAFDQSIKYDMQMEVPKAKLGSQANNVMSSLLGKANSAIGTDVKIPDLIPVTVTIGGTVTDPKVITNLKGQVNNVVNDLKDKVVDTLKKTFNAEVDKIMADARAQAEKIRAEAKVQADKLRAEGAKSSEKAKQEALQVAEKLKAEAYKAAEDVEKSAKNPLEKIAKKKLADKMRKEADEKYQSAVSEAEKKAAIPQNQANQKADALEAEADKKANAVVDAAQVKADNIKQ